MIQLWKEFAKIHSAPTKSNETRNFELFGSKLSKVTSVVPLASIMIPIITAKTDGNSANVNAII